VNRATVAVVGAGIAGLACARELSRAGIEVAVYEKSRGNGGRLATRRADPYAFDHGAQYFTVRDERFAEEIARWQAADAAAEWLGTVVALRAGGVHDTKPHRRFVGVPGMSAIGRAMAAGLDVRHEQAVTGLAVQGPRWAVIGEHGRVLGVFDRVVVAVPAPQAAALLAASPALAALAKSCDIAPCWALMAAFDHRLPLDYDGAFVEDAPLAWIMRNGSKPGRPDAECWVLHAGPAWTREHLELDKAAIPGPLLDVFEQVTGITTRPLHAVAHRWRYALPEEPLTLPFLLDEATGLAACGDWCGGPRVEGAFLSGLQLGQALAR
jgi:predicted NAD/FAD-dependent oxidoreductase